jgi:hypothetical protein
MLDRPGADVLRYEGGFDVAAGHGPILASAPAPSQHDRFDSRGSACSGESFGDRRAAGVGTSPTTAVRPERQSASLAIPDIKHVGRAFLIVIGGAVPRVEAMSLVEALGSKV